MRPEPQERRRGRWALFGGRHRPEADRAEPQMNAAQPSAPRANVQTVSNLQPQQRASNAPQANADDLFPDFKKDDQFEIPAFLRRQTN
jgi:hypothetical protein